MKSDRPLDCLVAGEANADLLIDGISRLEFEKEKLAKGMKLVLGGSSSIFAFNRARLGANDTGTGLTIWFQNGSKRAGVTYTGSIATAQSIFTRAVQRGARRQNPEFCAEPDSRSYSTSHENLRGCVWTGHART
jgi:hypothetical protein